VKERNGRGQFRATETLAYKKKLKNHFGQFDDVSKEAFMEAAAERYDFKQCQRQDGSIYGVSDKSACSQKGAKEVKADKGGEGGGNLKTAANKKLLDGAVAGNEGAKKKYESNLDKMGTHALRDQITNNVGKSQGRSATDSGAPLPTDHPEKLQYAITESFDRINKIRKGEGKEPMSLTSIVDAVDLQRIGIDPNKANSLAKQGKSIKGAIRKDSKSTSNKGNVARLAPKTEEDYKRKPRLLESDDSRST